MITCFTPNGYIRLARSLIRFCGMRRGEATTFMNICARANFDALRADPANECVGEVNSISLSLLDAGKPYHTEVQLYKSMQALSDNLGGERNEAVSYLIALQNDVSDCFWASYDMDIEDECTTYALCERTLEPGIEPAVCLREDLKG